MAESGNSFLIFQASRQKDFQQIARATQGEYSAEDLENEAWVIADQIGKKRGADIDFADPDDQQLVMRWLYNEVVRYTDKNVRCAVRLDKDWDMEDSESAENRLAALLEPQSWSDWHQSSDFEEEQLALLKIIEISYSQFSAYMILLNRFGWDLEELADALKFALARIENRIAASHKHMSFQPSLFDRIEMVDRDFKPMRGYGIISVAAKKEGPLQLAWDFA